MTPPFASSAAPVAGACAVAALKRFVRGIVVSHSTDPGTAERLSSLGLGIGASIRVLIAGACAVVQVGQSRIGLGPDLSRALLVVPL